VAQSSYAVEDEGCLCAQQMAAALKSEAR